MKIFEKNESLKKIKTFEKKIKTFEKKIKNFEQNESLKK